MQSKNEKVVIVNSMNPQSLLQVKCEDNSKIILNITFSQRHFSSQNIYSVAQAYRNSSVFSQVPGSRLALLELNQLLLVPIRGLGASIPGCLIITIRNSQLLIFLHSPQRSDTLNWPKTRVDKPAQKQKHNDFTVCFCDDQLLTLTITINTPFHLFEGHIMHSFKEAHHSQ